MAKIIIHNSSRLSEKEALMKVCLVIDHGRKSNDGKQYSYLTISKGICIATRLNKDSDVFYIYDNEHISDRIINNSCFNTPQQ